MYGKKRITITNDKHIVLAGGKSWIPIGRYFIVDGLLVGKLRNVDSWETKLDEKNSIDFSFSTMSELRSFVKNTYKTRL